jgi:ribosomal protein S18 acetylase RimI-like enzyme
MPISTREATIGDVSTLVDMMREFYAEAQYALDSEWAKSSFSALLTDSSRGGIWIVYLDDAAAGYVVVTYRFSMEFGGMDAFIDDLFVFSKYRRQGIGKAALTAAFEACVRRQILAVHVETSTNNSPAVALYGGFGMRDRQRLLLTKKLTSRCEVLLIGKQPNQLPDPTSPSVTPPARAGGAPSVAADH